MPDENRDMEAAERVPGDPPAGPWRRNSTDWLHDAGWGVCLHLCFHAAPEMSAGDWNRLVDGFDVTGLAGQLAGAAVPYVLLTIGQGSGHYCAPNELYDRYAGIRPSKCSRRNLVNDLSGALAVHGASLMVYAPADGSWADHEARRGLGLTKHWNDGKPYQRSEYRLPEFQRRWEDICRFWSLSFGRKVRGWIIDGAYRRKIRYPDDEPPNLRTYAEALRAGNPEAIISFNSGANALQVAYSPYEDFISGELIGNLPTVEAGFYRHFCQPTMPEAHYGPIQRFVDGEQYHLWNFLGCEWGKGEPRLPTELVAGYTRYVIDHDAVITWDVPILPEGRIAEPFMDQLRAIAAALRRPAGSARPGEQVRGSPAGPQPNAQEGSTR